MTLTGSKSAKSEGTLLTLTHNLLEGLGYGAPVTLPTMLLLFLPLQQLLRQLPQRLLLLLAVLPLQISSHLWTDKAGDAFVHIQ